MPDKSRVPAKFHPFDAYINATDGFLQSIDQATSQPQWQRLGLSSQNAADWHSRRVQWRDTLFPKHIDPLKRNVGLTGEVTAFRKEFKQFTARLLDRIAVADAADERDEAVFNLRLKKHRKQPSYHQTQIKEGMMISADLLSGGMMKISCRTSHDTKRPSLAAIANSVQVAYSIGGTPLKDPEVGTVKEVFTRATFLLDLGTANIGKWLYLYIRWYHTKHPRLAGPWIGMKQYMIA